MSELVIRHGLKLDANLTVSNGEPLLARTASTGLVSTQTGSVGGASAPFSDSTPLLFNNIDSSKLAQFSAANISTGTVRTYNLPDQDGTLLLGTPNDFWKTAGTSLLTAATNIETSGFNLLFDAAGGGNISMNTSSAGLVIVGGSYTATLVDFEGKGLFISGLGKSIALKDTALTWSNSSDVNISNIAGRVKFESSSYTGQFANTATVNFNLGGNGDPLSLVNGDFWYNTLSGEFKGRTPGGTIVFGTGGGGGGTGAYWPLAGSESLTADTTIFLNAKNIKFSGSAYEVGVNETSVGAYPVTIKHVANNKYLGLSDSGIQVLDEGIELFRATNSDLVWNNAGGNINISQAAAGTFTFTNKVSFTSENSSAPINIGGSADAVGTVNGDIWYDATNHKLRIREGGVSKDVADPFAVIEDVTTTTYTFVAADHQKVKRFTNASGCTATVPLGLRVGWTTTVYRASGAGTVTLASNGALESSAATLETEKTAASIVHRGSDVHVAWGALGTIGGGGSGISGLTANRIPYATGATTIADDSALTWSPTNNVLTVNGSQLIFNIDSSGSYYIAGPTAATGARNVVLGGGSAITAAGFNTIIGAQAGDATNVGFNTIIGSQAARVNAIGANNTLLGAQAGEQMTGASNTYIGYRVGNNASHAGNNNVIIGASSGQNITTASETVLLGYSISAPAATGSGQLSIQNAIYGVSNTGTGTTLSTGRIGLYVSSPTARLHLPAGAAAANNAPLKFTTGVALTTPSDGAMEYHGSHLYFTIGSTRHQLDQQVTIGNTQVAFGAGTNVLGGDSAFIYNSATNLLTVDNISLAVGSSGNISSGTYTPTGTADTNCSAITTTSAQYIRIGNVVTVSGTAGYTTAASGSTRFRLTLPIASNLGLAEHLAGTAAGDDGAGFASSAAVSGDLVNDQAKISFQAPGAGTWSSLRYTYTYRIL